MGYFSVTVPAKCIMFQKLVCKKWELSNSGMVAIQYHGKLIGMLGVGKKKYNAVNELRMCRNSHMRAQYCSLFITLEVFCFVGMYQYILLLEL